MPLFQGTKAIEGTRSHTHLIKSGHAAPATDLVLSKIFLDDALKSIWNEGVIYKYPYGGTGVEDVTIPMARLVGVCDPEFNFHDQLYKTPIALPGLSRENNVIGVVPYNICKDYLEEDKFGGNKPGFITTEYIILPLQTGIQPSTDYSIAGVLDEELRITVEGKMPFGSCVGEIAVGDRVKATPSGRFCKWVKGTDESYDIVGKVIEIDLNAESWGWLKWMMLNPSEKDGMDKTINRSGTSSLPTDYGYPFDPAFREGHGIYDLLNQYQSQFTSNPQGLQGLHDGHGNFEGFGRNDTIYKDMQLGNIPTVTVDGTMVVMQAVDAAGAKAKNIVADSVKVTVDGVAVPKEKFSIDEQYGTIAIEATIAQTGKAVVAEYKLLHFGTPSYLDFKDVVGSVSILLSL